MIITGAFGTNFLGDRGRPTCNECLAVIHNPIKPDYLGFFQLKDSLTYFFTEVREKQVEKHKWVANIKWLCGLNLSKNAVSELWHWHNKNLAWNPPRIQHQCGIASASWHKAQPLARKDSAKERLGYCKRKGTSERSLALVKLVAWVVRNYGLPLNNLEPRVSTLFADSSMQIPWPREMMHINQQHLGLFFFSFNNALLCL